MNRHFADNFDSHISKLFVLIFNTVFVAMVSLFRQVGRSDGWRRMGCGRIGSSVHTSVREKLDSRHPGRTRQLY